MKYTLIDTASWVEALRSSGKKDVRDKVFKLMTDGVAAWCELVQLELWNGARGKAEKDFLKEIERDLIFLEINKDVWKQSIVLARDLRSKAITVPATDILIASCAKFYDADLESCDSDFKLLK